jgi:hypothetical protein
MPPSAQTEGIAMSLEQIVKARDDSQPTPNLETLIARVVEITMARLEDSVSHRPFLTSRECARLLAVTPEHLCAMRSRGEGPPWSGEGRWIRYERRAVLRWLSSLPRQNTNFDDRGSDPDANGSEPTLLNAASQNANSSRPNPNITVGSAGRLS